MLNRLLHRNSDIGSKSNVTYDQDSYELPPLPDLEFFGVKPTTKRILDDDLAHNIRNLLPPRLQLFTDWTLLYSIGQHGISLNTLYENCKISHQLEQLQRTKVAQYEVGYGDQVITRMIGHTKDQKRPLGYVLVIEDNKGHVFGAYLNENLKLVDHKRYYGNGECFVWKVEKAVHKRFKDKDYSDHKYHEKQEKQEKQERKMKKIDKDPVDHKDNDNDQTDKNEKLTIEQEPIHKPNRFKAFMYSGINDNLIYSNHDFIAIGSSNGENAIFINQSLDEGVSCVCETFGNEVLNSNDQAKVGKFKINGLEVWRVGNLE